VKGGKCGNILSGSDSRRKPGPIPDEMTVSPLFHLAGRRQILTMSARASLDVRSRTAGIIFGTAHANASV